MKCPHNERLDYNPDTGVITWAKSNSNRVKNGGVAGYINRQGYRMIQICKRKVPASHIAWAALHPDDPILEGEEIDHINHNPTDDRAINLRKTNHRGNCRNRTLRTDSKYGLSGLGWRKKESRWIIQVGPKGAAYRGLFPDLLSAAAEVFRARKELGFHENHGEPKNG